MNYNITDEDKIQIDKKLESQVRYLKENQLYKSSYGANIRPDKYISELYNRVNTIRKFAKSEGLKPIFITITAPSEYHKYRSTPKGKFRFNKNYKGHSINETAKYLSEVWASFLRTNKMNHYVKNKHYFRTYEPHKDGTPHIHALLYVPEKFVTELEIPFENLMARESIEQYKFIYEFDKSKYGSDESSSVAYIMKYINKSFKNSKSNKMGDVAYWYAKHNIRRFLTSRSLIPLMVYRKINYKEEYQNMYKSTRLHKNKQFIKDSNGSISFIEYDYDLGECVETAIFHKDAEYKPQPKKLNLSFKERKRTKLIPVMIDGVIEYYLDKDFNKIYPSALPVNKLSNQDLSTQYYKMEFSDVDSIELARYGNYKNEMIKRGLLEGNIVSLNEYQSL